jgi:hypothetical protein
MMDDSSENLSPRVGADRNDLPDPTMGVVSDDDAVKSAIRTRKDLERIAASVVAAPQDRNPVAAARRVTKAEVDEADERGAMQINIMNASLKHGDRKLWTSADFRRLRVMLQVLEQSARGSDAEGFAGTSIGAVQSTYDATLNAVASALGVVPQE